MSKTNRTHMTDGNYREARKGRKESDAVRAGWKDALPGDFENRPDYSVPWQTRHTRGGMLMSSHSTGCWNDEDPDKRSIKRGKDARRARAAIDADLAEDTASDSIWASLRESDRLSGLG